jgi:hypothetical protein
MGLEAAICFAEMYKSGDKEDRAGMQIANPNLVVKTEPPKKRMYQNPKSLFKEILEHHDLTQLWIRVPLALRRMPSCELLVVEYPHGDEVFNGLLVAFRFPPFLRHDPCFLLRITFCHDFGHAGERGNGGGLIGGDFGCIRVGERKKKAMVANGNGV